MNIILASRLTLLGLSVTFAMQMAASPAESFMHSERSTPQIENWSDKAVARWEKLQALAQIPPSQFEGILFALNPPRGVVASSSAPQLTRATELLNWLESHDPSLFQNIEIFLRKALEGSG